MHLLKESQIEELIALEKLLDAHLPICKAAPTNELTSLLRSWSHIVWNISSETEHLNLDEESIREGLELIEHPVFICGVHRSGTTLMRDLLDSHPQLSVLPSEGSFFTNLNFHIRHMSEIERKGFIVEEWLRRLVNPINQPPYWLLGKSSKEFSPYVQFGRIFNAWIHILDIYKPNEKVNLHLAIVLAYTTIKYNNELEKIKYWVDKTPVIERYYSEIRTIFPKAKFIHLIRHPENIYLSRKTMEPLLNIKSFINDLKLSFKSAIKHAQSSLDHYIIIKYEDLVDNTEYGVTRIVRFLDIEETYSLFHPSVSGIPSLANSSFTTSSLPGMIIKNNVETENKFNKKERILLSTFAKPALHLGYLIKRIGAFQIFCINSKTFFNHIFKLFKN